MPTFYDRFLQCAERWPANVAVELQRPDGTESYTYGQLRNMSESVAAWLAARGLEPGNRVAILADNHPRWVAAYLGIIAAGGTTVPLDTAYHADQVAKLLRDSGSVLLVCDAKHLNVAEEAAQGTKIGLALSDSGFHSGEGQRTPVSPRATIEADFDGIFAQYKDGFAPVPRSPDDLASLLYTSGTTADPKGVMLTHANLLAEADAVFAWAHIGPEDAILGVLPLFHVLSQMANLLLPLVAGTRVVYLSTLNTTELLRALRERNVTAFAVVPQFFNLIHERIVKEVQQRGVLARKAFKLLTRVNVFCRKLEFNPGRMFFRRIHDLFGRRMRYLVTGGSRFDPRIAQDFYSLGIDVLQAYGLTETCGGAFVNSPTENVIGSVGKPLKGVESRIADAQASDDGSPASGEILIRGPIVMKGYWNRPDATAEVLKDGRLHTGDLGYFDEGGNLFITGRKKDVIILANGKNIYPEEIETHYLQSPFIKDICVMGIEDAGTEKLYAVIVPNFEVLRQRKVVNAKEVIRFDVEGLSAKLASTKRIGGYEIWQEDLPRTTTRKLKRFEIEKRVRAGKRDSSGELSSSRPLTDEETAWLENEDVKRALKVIRAYAATNPEAVRPGDNLELDIGLDSMRRVELLIALEQELGGSVEESQLGGIYTVRELVDAVRQKAGMGVPDTGKTALQFAGWGVVLREDPTDPEAIAAGKSRPITDRLLYVLTRIAKVIWRMRAPIEVEGLENLPQAPFLLCSNHQSFIDPLFLLMMLPVGVLLHLFAVGTSEVFGTGLMRRVARILRVVVVDPDANLMPAMRAGAYGLRHGMSLILYPEGERSIDGTPKTFKKGAAILSIHLQVPVVPIAIDGVYEAWPRGKPFQKFAPIKIKFGKTILPPPEAQASEETYSKLTAELKARVVEMWEELRSSKALATQA
ncbi:MAG TPA: AMP-binding protein [Terriglobales bacterium]|nr:AMP-binding protein [Terriglobales bacterium]